MVTHRDLVHMRLDGEAMEVVRRMAQKAEIGGKSRVRESTARQASLANDQLIGQCGEAAVCLYLTGSLSAYIERREAINATPLVGDNGSDIPGSRIDVKASALHTSRPILQHRLAVRPAEKRVDSVYVQCLCDVFPDWTYVVLVGWATADMLPEGPEESGVFAGAHILSCEQLLPLPRSGLEFWKKWNETGIQTPR